MKQPEIFRKIGGILQELNDQYDYLRTTADNLNDLELELFVANAHFLKDHAEILLKLNAIKPQAPLALPQHQEPAKPVLRNFTAPVAAEPKYFEPVVQPVKPAPRPDLFRPEPTVTKPEPAKVTEPIKPAEPLIAFEPKLNNIAPPEPSKPETAPEPLKFDLPEPDRDEDAIKFEIGAPDEPAPTIDLSPAAPADTYSLERQEPETIRHELVLDEAADEASEQEELATPQQEEPASVEEKFDEPVNTLELPKAITKSMEHIQIEHLRSAVSAPIAMPAEPEPEKQAVKAEEPKPATAEPALTLNQRLSAQIKDKKSDTASAPSKAEPAVEPLADIKTAINLNDKLLFVKDLFKGYNLAYTEAIEIVNRFTSFEEADRFLKTNYVTKNNWEDKKETADKFYALLRRRYA